MVTSLQDPLTDDVKDLESLGHLLRNGIFAIQGSMKAIEFRIQYMKKGIKKYEEILRNNNDSLDKAGCFRTPKPPNP